MNEKIIIHKLHSSRNDFLVLDEDNFNKMNIPEITSEFVKNICDRKSGIGADQFLLLKKNEIENSCTMKLWNDDGSYAEMTGNGSRCISSVALKLGYVKSLPFTLVTDAGEKEINGSVNEEGYLNNCWVNMGIPIFEPEKIPVLGEVDKLEITLNNKNYFGYAVGLGNPVFAVYIEDAQVDIFSEEWNHDCSNARYDKRFPNQTNFIIFQKQSEQKLVGRIWERGTGETESCGTALTGASAVAKKLNLVDESFSFETKGGLHKVLINKDGSISMDGKVEWVFDSELVVNGKKINSLLSTTPN